MNTQVKLLTKAHLAREVLLALARDYWDLNVFGLATVNEMYQISLNSAEDRVNEILNMSDEGVVVRTAAYNEELEYCKTRPLLDKEEAESVELVVARILSWTPESDELRELQDWASTTLYGDLDYCEDEIKTLGQLTPEEWRNKMLEDAIACVREQKTRLSYAEAKVEAINSAMRELKNANI